MFGARQSSWRRVSTVLLLLGASLACAPGRADASGLPGLRVSGARLLDGTSVCYIATAYMSSSRSPWGAPGRMRAESQPRAPDADHSPAMWASLAATFKRDSGVILSPWGEPVVTPRCLLRGGSACPPPKGTALSYRIAGMQQAVNVMRAAGYRGPIAIPGISYANDMSHWLAFEPRDPQHELIAEAHVYGKNACSSPSCFNKTMIPVARRVPLIFGETGETYDASSCAATIIETFLRWADDHGVGYAAWTWDTWRNCDALISNFQGRPFSAYGAFVKGYLAGIAAGAGAPSTATG